jgi:hypothetical protein
MIILPNRVKLIEKHFFEFSFDSKEGDDPIPDFKIFKKLSSAEQYYLASIYNWDDGITVLNWIIDSPKCDKGTATMIFWMAEPDYYFDYSEATIGEYDKDVFDLLQKILVKIKNKEFKRSRFGFNPKQNKYKTDWETASGIWRLPKDLTKGTLGIKPLAIRR